MRHPGVVAVYDVDEPARALAMEWIAGGTLRARLAAHPDGLPAAEVAATARGLLATLAFLHGQGIVHGDLKPSNLLLRAPGEVVLADFGAAVQLDREAGRATPVGEAGGTPLYLAPSNFREPPPRRETDLYAAGAMLWEAATGPLAAEPRGPAPARPAGRRGRFRRGGAANAGRIRGRTGATGLHARRARVPAQPRLFWLFLIRRPSQSAGGLGRGAE